MIERVHETATAWNAYDPEAAKALREDPRTGAQPLRRRREQHRCRRRLRTMTQGKLETARQLRSEGKTLKETAERLSVSVSSLTRALSRNEVSEVESAAG
jgi:transcriptional regulator NrdR family protein